jgi:nucleoside phosphorylase
VLFQADPGFPLTERLLAAGARRGRFHCAERVVLTAAEKSHLRASTGADAVEMESHWLRECCTPQGVPCATVRVILDTASEDLPLDFNLLCGPAGKLSSRKLTFALGKSPHKIPALIRLGIQTRKASRRLGAVLQATF